MNQAQKAYVEQAVKAMPHLAGIPILSAGAPFKAVVVKMIRQAILK